MKSTNTKPPICFFVKSLLIAIVFLCNSFLISAQTNLVPNPSFENYTTCKPGTGIYNANNPVNNYITSWNRPTYHQGKPYNFTPCNGTGNYSVPNNKVGTEAARTGNAYVGLQTYKASNNVDRQYIQTQLSTPLIAGKVYEASMYVSLADYSEWATNGLGMYFSVAKIQGMSNKENLPYTPQVVSSSIITTKNGWALISGIFVANGGERYLTIGNFKTNLQTLKSIAGTGSGYGNNRAFYYIDDVKLVEMACSPVAAFSTTPVTATGVAPFSVTFIDQSTCTPTSWAWSITPNTGFTYTTGNSTSKNPVITFNTTGIYSVILTATNAYGSNTSAAKTITVTVPPPVASFTAAPLSGTRLTSTGLAVTFTSTSTNTPTSLAWDIGNNGTTEGTTNPFVHNFPVTAAGSGSVKLTATNAGGSHSITNTYNLLMPNPSVDYNANGSSSAISGTAPFAVTLNNTTNSYGYPNTYVWTISPATGFSYVGGTNANSQTPQLSFTNAGTYSITLTANTADGGTGSITKTGFITVTQNLLPIANFTPLSTTATGTSTITFNSSSSTGSPTSYLWAITPSTGVTFMSGTATSANPTVKFDNTGITAVNYTVSLTVTNAYGNHTKTQSNCVVINPVPPVIYYSRTNGNWNANATWSTVSHTSGTNTGTYPKVNDIVYVKHSVTIPGYRTESCREVTLYAANELFVFGNLNITTNMNITNASGVTGGICNFIIDSSGVVNAGGTFNVTLNSGNLNMTLGRSKDDGTDPDPDWRIEEDGEFNASNFNISLTGVAGYAYFTTASASSSMYMSSGHSTIYQNTNSTGKIRFALEYGSSMDFSGNDSLKIDHIAGGDLEFIFSGYEDATLELPTTVVNQKSGIVWFDIDDGGILDVDGDFILNIKPLSSTNITATVNITLGSRYNVGENASQEWLSSIYVDNNLIINQTYGGNIAIDFNGYLGDGWFEGPTLEVWNDLIIDHNATGKNVTFSIGHASTLDIGNSTVLKNSGTGGIEFNLVNEAVAYFSDLIFQTGLSEINAGAKTKVNVNNINFQTTGSFIDMGVDALLNIKGNITKPITTSNLIASSGNSTIAYIGSTPQTVAKTGSVTYVNLKIMNPSGVSLEGAVSVPSLLTLQKGKVNLNTYELTLGTSASNNGELKRTTSNTTIIDSIVQVPNPAYNYLCQYYPSNCINGAWYNTITYSSQVQGDGDSWLYGGKFTRWMPNTLITQNSDSALFPMGTATAANRALRLAKTSVTGSNGKVSVTHTDVAGDATVNINDLGTYIKYRTNSNWNVTSTISTSNAVKFDMSLQGKDLGFTAGLDKIRINKATTVVGTHSTATGQLNNPKGNRTNISTAQITGIFYLGSTSTSGVKSFQLEEETTEVEIAEEGIVINNFYPNPVVSEAFLNINNVTESTQVEIQIMDLTGRIVFSGKQNVTTGENNISINTNELNSGTYLLRIISEKGSDVKRFIKAE